MVFNSFEFFVFLAIVLAVYWLSSHRLQNVLLLVASYVFYGWWDWRFLSLIVVSTLADFFVAQRLHASGDDRVRRRWLFGSLGVNLGILGFFKYFDFFVGSASDLLGSLGWDVHPALLRIVLPVGISFYTFQTISYTFDVFRRRISPERDLVTFGVYVAFFPQLVAGPIERAQQLLPQIQSERIRPRLEQVWSGSWLILTGLFKKVVLADGIAVVVQSRFDSPAEHGALSLALGAYAFAIQIYGDFSGYSSIARGVSRLFGIELMRNFEQPYLSTNISQFWRTWHISLSTWLWDYLYVPLGGNRRGRRRTYINLMLVMLIGGLWHGAAWTFVIWGGLHGLYLSVHRTLGRYEPRGRPPAPTRRDVWRILVTFHAVVFAWIFFRADSLGGAIDYLSGLTRLGWFTPGWQRIGADALTVGMMALAVLAMDLVDRRRTEIRPLLEWSRLRLGVAMGLMIFGVFVYSGGTQIPFIYFQF